MNIVESIKKYSKNPYALFDRFTNGKTFHSMDDRKYLEWKFRGRMGYPLNLDDPKTYSEKIQWMKLYDRNPLYTTMVDKYTVKDYVAGIIGKEYIIPTLGVWDRFEDIDFDQLPSQFVLKCNHDSGGLVICKDKSQLDLEAARKKITECLQRNFYYYGREWPYKNVKPKIICEKYMKDDSGSELKDYKFMCFNGVPKIVQIHSGRFEQHFQDYYDIDSWKKIYLEQPCMPNSDEEIEKLPMIDDMAKLSAILSKDIPSVRIDWYFSENHIYFGEITFFDGSGFDRFTKYEDDLWLGSLIKLPKKI